MNVTALLDVPAQRSVSPLDSAVGDDAADPAFANVMSRYQSADNNSLTSDASKAQTETNGDTASNAVAQTNVADSAATAEQAPTASAADANASGDALPPAVIPDGQILPLLDAANPDAGLPDVLDHPKPDCELDATDPNAALMAVIAPAPPPVPSNTGAVTVATAPLDPGAARPPVEAPPIAATQASDAAVASDPDPASLTPIDPVRLTKKDGDAAALAGAANPVTDPTDDDTAPRPAPAAHALRALGLAHGQGPIANGSQSPSGGDSRNPNGSSGDPSGRDGAPKIANAHLAAALEAAAQKDPAKVHRDGSETSIRTDASTRLNGPVEGARDIAATRLGDLAQQHAPRFAAELADRVLVLRSQRFDSATVSLEPRDLGRIDIQVRMQADTMHVAFTTQHAAVRDALEGQMPRLRAMLEEAGLSLGSTDVSQSGNRGAGDQGTSRAYLQPQTSADIDAEGLDSSTRWQRRVETSLIDLHA